MNYKLLMEAKDAYLEGLNIIDLVGNKYPNQRSLAIEVAYDLQAGSYIKDFYANSEKKKAYTNEGGDLLQRHISDDSVILNVGAGELWTISLMLDRASIKPKKVFNLEISWSRINVGRKFWREIHNNSIDMQPFVADMLEIPLPSNSVDVITSSHALEPNGIQLDKIISELFRVSRHKCVLFEPHYESCTTEGRLRMDKLGYIKNLEKTVNKFGGKIEELIPVLNSQNPLNPTSCFVIKVPIKNTNHHSADCFTIPGTDYHLEHKSGAFYSIETGLTFPILGDIPILKTQSSILASKF
jgi:SAM-dependent methyltransferase